MKFNSSELLAIGDCIALRIDELNDRLENFEDFGDGVKDWYKSELEKLKKIQSKLKEF